MRRRTFLGVVGAGGASVAGPAASAAQTQSTIESLAILVDLSVCIGCRMCEFSCAEANGLPKPDWDGETVNEIQRPTSEKQWTVVNRHETSRGSVFVKSQCMHCLQPACAAACLTKALVKTEEGPVIWREDKCMGCRFCMISCPFDVPKFEYDSANPRIQKCRMCWERLNEGAKPACVQNCPTGALSFGTRDEMLQIAHERIYQNPGKYVSHIFGEHEVGGTGVLYISPVPFEEVGFPTHLGNTAYPEYTRGFLTAVPFVLLLWPAFLLSLRRSTMREENEETEPDGAPVGEV